MFSSTDYKIRLNTGISKNIGIASDYLPPVLCVDGQVCAIAGIFAANRKMPIGKIVG
ncbi:hypothetical protein NEISICOT_02063 [Neisseria sicca ATCC 29256]|uniref:Uncharacterized protein n=1 Tax=Neisseria sicca ATCC 29256 TaxID=547045 RepID=C6M6B1_NEISI|nr:hypothetical protein NEISICOT_02063 [Neisseria sicca ATCC 29256]